VAEANPKAEMRRKTKATRRRLTSHSPAQAHRNVIVYSSQTQRANRVNLKRRRRKMARRIRRRITFSATR